MADEVNLLYRPEVWQKYTELREQLLEGGYQTALKWSNEQDPTATAPLTPYLDSILTDAAMLSGEYAAALDRYRKLLGETTVLHDNLLVTSTRVDERIHKAIALHKLGRKEEAQQEFQKILDRFLPSFDRVAPEINTYAVVSSLAWLGRGDEAVAALRKSIDRGWKQEAYLTDWYGRPDPAVEPIRERADFQELIAQVRERNFLEFERVKASGRPLIPEIAPKAAAGAAAGH